MKNKILKGFLIAALVGGTLGTAFAQENGKGNKPKSQEECESAGRYWFVKDEQKSAKCWNEPQCASGC